MASPNAQPKSGTYQRSFRYGTWTLRLDVDHNHPQFQASLSLPEYNAHWVAAQNPSGGSASKWVGDIWYYNEGANVMRIKGRKPDHVRISWGRDGRGQYVNLYLYVGTELITNFYLNYVHEFFRETEFEYDYEEGVDHQAAQEVKVEGSMHTLKSEFEKAGVKITVNREGNAIRSSEAGTDAKWNNAELQDAMQAHWSRANGTPWALWVFFARHCEEEGVLGRMFDNADDHQRNGTVIFTGAHEGLAHEKEYLFQTVVHEVGHAFNLSHSWAKTLDSWRNDVKDEPEALSYMNYPWRYAKVKYGSYDYSSFFDEFEYRFSNQELTFLRHAPTELVEMGNSSYLADHGSLFIREDESVLMQPSALTLALIVRLNKQQPVFQYLEPVHIELKLQNTGTQPLEVDANVLDNVGHMSIWVRRNGIQSKRYAPFSRVCYTHRNTTLPPGQSMYNSLFLSAGRDGWLVAEPGKYSVNIVLTLSDGTLLESNALQFAVLAPNRQVRQEKERLAQDYFSENVGRTLAFNGSKLLQKANDTLHEVKDRFSNCAAATHAALVLAAPAAQAYKLVDMDDDGPNKIKVDQHDEQAGESLKELLMAKGHEACETLGNIHFQRMAISIAEKLKAFGDQHGAQKMAKGVLDVLDARQVKLPQQVRQHLQSKIEKGEGQA